MKSLCLIILICFKAMLCKSGTISGMWAHCGSNEFYVSSISTSGQEAHTMCEMLTYHSVLAGFDDAQYIKDNCIQILHNDTYWIDDFCQDTCSMLSKYNIDGMTHIEKKPASCLSTLIPICRPIRTNISSPQTNSSCLHELTTSTRTPITTVLKSTTDVTTDTLDTPNTSKYFINYEFTNYQEAGVLCEKKYNASLITCPSVTSYFTAIANLNPENGSYWVGGSDSATDCLFYNSNDNFLSTSNCDNKMKSICRRYTDSVDDVLEIPTFKKLIKDMTVNKSDTFIANMKLNCLDDERTSAKMVGGFGVIVMVAVGAIFMLFDSVNLFRCCKVTT